MLDSNKICWVCKTEKDKSEFFKDKHNTKDGLQGKCKPCNTKHTKKWFSENKERTRFLNKRWQKSHPNNIKSTILKSTFGITLEQYKILLKNQDGKCAICLNLETTKNRAGKIQALCVDHNHQTGKIRALLCNNCNRGIGYLKDNSEIIMNAYNYLKKHD